MPKVSDLRPGDKFLVEFICSSYLEAPKMGCVALLSTGHGGSYTFHEVSCEVHSILPKPISVGDTVLAGRTTEPYKVLAIDGANSWLKHCASGVNYASPVSILKRIL